MIKSKILSKEKKINHGFFNSKGGKSSGIYKSLNCGPGSKDKISKIRENLKIVRNRINKKAKKIFLVNQIHSDKFIFVGNQHKFKKKKFKADAIITDQKKIPIAVLTADCTPVLLYDTKKNVIAAIHAGWKGAFKGIISKVINFMIKIGCTKKSIIAVIGPCIRQQSYEVGKDFKYKFIKRDKKNKIFFRIKKKKIFFNLPNFIKSQLISKQITKIDTINIDTFSKNNNFFSARRSLKLGHNDYGRNISIIMIN